jgi:hypothetical protein
LFTSRQAQFARVGATAFVLLLAAATGCGGDDDSSDSATEPAAAPPAADQANADQIKACLKKAGTEVERAKSPSSGPTVLTVPLGRNGTFALVEVYDSADAAAAAEKGITAFFKVRGGNAELKGNVVLGYNAKSLPQNARKQIEACL